MSADPDYVRANDDSRARLRTIVERLDRTQLTQSPMPGWSVSALLAHLAFWDRFNVQRWRSRLAGTQLPALDVLDDLINDSALPAWTALPPEVAARDVLASAEEGDAFVAGLTPEITSRWLEEGRPRSFYRSEHRREHLDEIERALAR
ncbi:MAG TPA: maleylpyruvate isomerase N-terminal domain-containing protein [Candidatus Limnocylindria bacterium]|nr:maleylpyruvate isomerase N-terminal domain-containing protein [Candidatus Limnocylindria bacterium]